MWSGSDGVAELVKDGVNRCRWCGSDCAATDPAVRLVLIDGLPGEAVPVLVVACSAEHLKLIRQEFGDTAFP
jgi:hypothetical protein